MSIKLFCDECGKDVTERNYASNRLVRKWGVFKVELLVAKDGVWNDGQICLACLIDAVTEGKESLSPIAPSPETQEEAARGK